MLNNIFTGFTSQQSPVFRQKAVQAIGNIFGNRGGMTHGGGLQMGVQSPNQGAMLGAPMQIQGMQRRPYDFMTRFQQPSTGGNATILGAMQRGGSNMTNGARAQGMMGQTDIMAKAAALRKLLGGF